MELNKAKEIMGKNFIGPEELLKFSKKLGVVLPKKIPAVPFSADFLNRIKKNYILFLGLPVSINKMLRVFRTDPKKYEPCFYNQDWYLKEKFASKKLEFKWYLIKKEINQKSRGKNPADLEKKFNKKESFPSAVSVAFLFFAYYFYSNKIIWEKDFIWCRDKDSNNDRIYVGRYKDPKKINKNGFNIHRHLSIKNYYGSAPEIL